MCHQAVLEQSCIVLEHVIHCFTYSVLQTDQHRWLLSMWIPACRSYLIGRIAVRALSGKEVDDVREEDD